MPDPNGAQLKFMQNSMIIGLLGWIFPGAGHLAIGKVHRGILLAAVVWLMFAIALMSGGASYPGFAFKDGALLYLLNAFARFGNVVGGVVSMLLGANASSQVASWATFEYGGRFLEVSGLLNFMVAMDAVDLSLGRKK